MAGLIRRLKAEWRTRRAVAEIESRALAPRAHGLDVPLVVSLTSYPGRYGTLERTLKGLTRQTVRPDHVILWLARGDGDSLPAGIRALAEVREVEDLRSYKKIVPALTAFPDAAIVTADDDVYYPADWLERLLAGQSTVRALRAHRVVLEGGVPAPYERWNRGLRGAERSGLVFPTGVLGVFYAPGVFHPDVTRANLFRDFAPDADDVWLYWMHRMTGQRAEKVGGHLRVLEWPGSQRQSLRAGNIHSGNDRAVAAMVARYGFPSSEG